MPRDKASTPHKGTVLGMETRQRYRRAPIIEALIDFRVQLPEPVELDTLMGVDIDYPTREDINVLQSQISFGSAVGASASQTQVGYRFISRDKRQIIQMSLQNFTFSRLEPYDCWETFRDEAQRLWEIYSSAVQPQMITRIAVRYINRLNIPFAPLLPLDLKDYLRTVPEVSPDLTQGLSNYFMQLQIPQEDIASLLILNQALVPPPNSEVVSILLDIDLFREVNLADNDDQAWGILELLCVRKDKVFEACITDRMRELID